MKSLVYDNLGEKGSETEMPKIFNSPIREDIVAKYVESEKFVKRQPYSPYSEAGKRHSASGTISHKRHEWKGHYGKGISRTPRKTMSRRGTQFYWIGAEVSHTRGGRVAHPPQGIYSHRKINKKEKNIATNSAFAATFNKEYIKKRYLTADSKMSSAVIESLPKKSKQLFQTLEKIFSNSYNIILQKRHVRAGKGKRRGRKYKSAAGLLILTGKDEKFHFAGIDVKKITEVRILDLYPLGRITLYTKKALEDLQNAA
ncbi:MAG: 50S ribosomal protein L4 [Nanoarchaeota archaeon]